MTLTMITIMGNETEEDGDVEMAVALSANLDLNDPAIEPLNAGVVDTLIGNHRAFLRHLERRLHSRDEAEDVLQDFYLRVMAKAKQIKEPGSTRAWLYKVLASVLADYFRKRASEKRRMLGVPDANWRSILDDGAVDSIICDCVHDLLPGIKNEYAVVLRRADLLQEPRSKIAEELGTTQANIRVRLHRARQAMRKLLELSCLSCPEHGFLKCDCERPLALRRKAEEYHRENCNDPGGDPSDRAEAFESATLVRP